MEVKITPQFFSVPKFTRLEIYLRADLIYYIITHSLCILSDHAHTCPPKVVACLIKTTESQLQ